MTRIPIGEAAQKLRELSELASGGETFGLLKDGELIALLGPPPGLGKAHTGHELARRIAHWPKMAPAEAEAFARDVEEAIRVGNNLSPEIDWPS